MQHTAARVACSVALMVSVTSCAIFRDEPQLELDLGATDTDAGTTGDSDAAGLDAGGNLDGGPDGPNDAGLDASTSPEMGADLPVLPELTLVDVDLTRANIAVVVGDANNLELVDTLLIDHLRVGYDFASDPRTEASAPPAGGFDAVLLAETSTSTQLDPAWLTVPVPFVANDRAVWEDMRLCSGSYTENNPEELDIVDPTHPIATGYTVARYTYSTTAARLGRCTTDTWAASISTIAEDTANRPAVAAFESGVLDLDGSPLPRRTVAFGPYLDALEGAYPLFVDLLFGSVEWVLAEPPPTLMHSCALLVNADQPPLPADLRVYSRMRRRGCDTTFVAGDVAGAQLEDYDLVVVSPSRTPPAFGSNLGSTSTPVVNLSLAHAGTAGFGMIDRGPNDPNFDIGAIVTWAVFGQEELQGELPSEGLYRIYDEGERQPVVGFDEIAEGVPFARAPDVDGNAVGVTWEVGAETGSGPASGRRVLLLLAPDTSQWHDAGRALFDASIDWALSAM